MRMDMQKLKNMTLGNIAAACGGTFTGAASDKDLSITSVSIDSREVPEGCLFIPIKGERVDGHDFIAQAIAAGAVCTLSEREIGDVSFPCIRVGDTAAALRSIAAYYLKQLGVPVVAITGSVGKTSTKEMIASVLSQRFRVHKTEGNYNNDIGLPLTIFQMRESDEMAVLEMGISDFGEMRVLSGIARPDTAVITNIGYCHLEFLHDRDGVFAAKTEIFENLKEDGHIVLNGDDDKLRAVRAVRGIRPVTFGIDSACDVWADHIESLGFEGMRADIHTEAGSLAVHIPIPGRHMVYNALAGACVGLIYGCTLAEIRAGIESVPSVDGRFHIEKKASLTVIDDCYNANPVSMKASLSVLEEGTGRKVAVLGDMGELGSDEVALHREVGTYAGGLKIDALYTCGTLAGQIGEAAADINPQLARAHFPDLASLCLRLPGLLKAGDTVLVKASHFMGFEAVVETLLGADSF